MRTAHEVEVLLDGADPGAVEDVVKVGAPARHRSRVRVAYGAAWDFAHAALGPLESHASFVACRVATKLVLLSDALGPMGHRGGTARHPALAACGTGRRHAMDGDAWSAAIATAARGFGPFSRLELRLEDGAPVLEELGTDEAPAPTPVATLLAGVAGAGGDAEAWARTLRAGLVVLALGEVEPCDPTLGALCGIDVAGGDAEALARALVLLPIPSALPTP